jgi:addiction module HigA family antidote
MIGLPTNRAPTHPGEMLNEEFLKPFAIKQKDAADDLGISLVRLNQIIKAKRSVTPDTALRLERRFGISAEFWLGLQADWDLYHTRHSREATAIKKIKRDPRLATA